MALRSRDVEVVLEELDDVELAGRASRGDVAAFEELYRRHVAAAWRLAQAVAANAEDAADAVSEAFTKLLDALGTGRLSPVVPFRPYLLTTTRNAVIDQHRHASRVIPDASVDTVEPPSTIAGPSELAIDAVDASLVVEAFRALPERWRSVLWMSEVEGLATSEVGGHLGLTPAGASQLAHRARSGLRERYLQAHIRHGAAPACAETVSQLGVFTAGSLSPHARDAVTAHLAWCADCQARAAELSDVGGALRAIVLPIPTGLGALTLARYKLAFLGLHQVRRGALLVRGADTLARSVALSAAVVLVLGLITAGLMSSGNNPSPVHTRTGGSIAIGPPVVTQLAGDGTLPPGVAASQAAIAADVLSGLADTSTPVPPSVSGCGPACPGQQPGGHGATGPPGRPGTSALVQVTLATNLDLADASLALGVGGGCTGLSLDRSASCAPTAPTTTGLDVGVASPLGPINVDIPPETSAAAGGRRAARVAHLATVSLGPVTLSL